MLRKPLQHIIAAVRAKKARRLPTVLARNELEMILAELEGESLLLAQLLYGAGPRVSECLRLRVKDIDFGQRLIHVRGGKGQKDRTTLMPEVVIEPMRSHLQALKERHHRDLQAGNGRSSMPMLCRASIQTLTENGAGNMFFRPRISPKIHSRMTIRSTSTKSTQAVSRRR